MTTGMILNKIATWTGLILLVWGASVYASALLAPSIHFEALTLPVSLAPGTIRTPEFTTDLDEGYEISLDFDQRSSVGNIECLLGSPVIHPDACKAVPDLIDISWKVSRNERPIAEGDSSSTVGTLFTYPKDAAQRIIGGARPKRLASVTYTDVIQRIIGGFRAQKGQRYSLALVVKRDASALQQAHPRLVVRIPVGLNEDYALGSWWKRVRGLLLGLIGVAVLVVSFCVRLLVRNASAGRFTGSPSGR